MATPVLSKEPVPVFNTEISEEMQDDNEKWVLDSSVDHKGNVPLRASTGAWKAALFIIAVEFGERLSFFGISTNLMMYLTKVLHEELKTAAKTVNYWTGVTTMLPLLGGFIADAYLGRFSTILFSVFIYSAGLGLLILSQLAPGLTPCTDIGISGPCHGSKRLHKIVFFLALYLISFGTGGHRPSLESFGADQFDDDHPKEKMKKMSYFNWWNFGLCSGLILGVTVIVYIEDNISFWASYVVLAVIMAIALFIFLSGRPFYRYRVPQGSTLTPIMRVLVAAVRKRHLPHPSDAGELYEVSNSFSEKRLLSHTNRFRFLDKAALIEHRNNEASGFQAEKHMKYSWRLATVTQVEELKLIINMIPVWLATIPFGISIAQSTTFFLKQCAVMDRRLTSSFEIPPASVFSLSAIGMIICVTMYDRILVPFFRRLTGNERGISILQRIGVGIALVVIGMVIAAIVEAKRLSVAHEDQSMSVFWLVPQFVILGFGDGFSLVGLQEYFYGQVPDSMRSLGIAFYLSVIGAANFLSSLLITVVDYVTRRGGGTSWFAKDLNKSRLDKFFWLLAAMDAVNIVVYILVARRHSYKSVQSRVGIANSSDADADADAEDEPRV